MSGALAVSFPSRLSEQIHKMMFSSRLGNFVLFSGRLTLGGSRTALDLPGSSV